MRTYVGISLDPDILAELDSRAADNRSAEIAATLRRWWTVLEFGTAQLDEIFGHDLPAAMAAVRAAGIDRPESPVVAFSEEFADTIDLGARLCQTDPDARARIYEAAQLLDYVGRVALVEAATRRAGDAPSC